MAQLIADSNGNILRFTTTYLEDNSFTDLTPLEYPNRVWFDEMTNTALVQDISKSFSHYTVKSGVLKKDGVTVTIAGLGQDAQDRLTLTNTIKPKLVPGNTVKLTDDDLKVLIRLGLNRIK